MFLFVSSLLGGAYPDLTYWDKPNRVKVKLISSQRKPSPCDSLDTASSYEFPDRSICLRAKKGGVNCGVSYWGE